MNDERREDFELPDGERTIKIIGQRLSHATSAAPGKDRWSEVEIYLTEGGTFVVAGVGRTTVDGESDHHWVQVCERPEAVVEKLYMVDDFGGRYLPNMNRRALTEACSRSGELNRAFMVEVVK